MTVRWKCLKFCLGFSRSVTGKEDITKEVIPTVDNADLIAYQKWNEFTCFTSVGIKLCVKWEIHYEILWLHCMCLNLVAYDADCTNWVTYADQQEHVTWYMVTSRGYRKERGRLRGLAPPKKPHIPLTQVWTTTLKLRHLTCISLLWPTYTTEQSLHPMERYDFFPTDHIPKLLNQSWN